MLLTLVLGLLAYWAKNTAIVLPAIGVLLQTTRPKAHDNSATNIGPNLSLAQWSCWAVGFAGALGISMRLGTEVGMFATRRGDSFIEVLAISATTWGELAQLCLASFTLRALRTQRSNAYRND